MLGRDGKVLVVAPNAEFSTLADVLLLRTAASSSVMHPNIQYVHPMLVRTVVPTHIGQ